REVGCREGRLCLTVKLDQLFLKNLRLEIFCRRLRASIPANGSRSATAINSLFCAGIAVTVAVIETTDQKHFWAPLTLSRQFFSRKLIKMCHVLARTKKVALLYE
ncbi:hypothetical protein, partial [Roseovarius sp.]|uniref:hypothetical protein n=1 Tax=Roseovarius sp. TaxID=1486281 RepID=UPI003561FD8E